MGQPKADTPAQPEAGSVTSLFQQFDQAAAEISQRRKAADAAREKLADAEAALNAAVANGQALKQQLHDAMDSAVPSLNSPRARVS